jgi:dTDP-4-amino-4,6-dideoxygalactose transaminase
MMRLPPVRRAVSLVRGSPAWGKATFHAAFPGYDAHLYDSGTTALAVAIAEARSRHGSEKPEAILPAYCCPDVVAACLFAGARPRLVDVAPGQWGYDPRQLQAALSRDTVAVVAVNLLGAGDDAAGVLPLVRANGSLLIQDSAQYLPPGPQAQWLGDYVVLSFGRGKPLNLLRGGALLSPRAQPLLRGRLGAGAIRARIAETALGSRAAAVAFNTITHPRLFGLTSRLPGLRLGATHYHALESATSLPDAAWGQVGPAYERYSREGWRLPWLSLLPEWERLGLELLSCRGAHSPADTRRLRLALLAQGRSQRDALVGELNRHGLGASVMYDVALNRVSGVPAEIAALPQFPNAEALADRLFTLPTHSAVTSAVVARTGACIRRYARGRIS